MGRLGQATADGVRIGYEVDGEPGDATIVLVHGLGYGRWGWEPVRDALAEHHRLLLVDNRGIGTSDVPAGPYTATMMAGDVAAVLDDAGVDRAHVIGTSLGGMISQELAIAHPERVDRLVLVASTPGGDEAHPIPAETRELIARMPEMDPAEALRAAIRNALAEPSDEIVERILHHRLTDPQDPAGWQAQAAAGTTYAAAGRLDQITAPTLVVQGDADRVIDPRNADLLASAIPDARVEMLEGVGHLAFWEAPEAFVAVVKAFLDEGR